MLKQRTRQPANHHRQPDYPHYSVHPRHPCRLTTGPIAAISLALLFQLTLFFHGCNETDNHGGIHQLQDVTDVANGQDVGPGDSGLTLDTSTDGDSNTDDAGTGDPGIDATPEEDAPDTGHTDETDAELETDTEIPDDDSEGSRDAGIDENADGGLDGSMNEPDDTHDSGQDDHWDSSQDSGSTEPDSGAVPNNGTRLDDYKITYYWYVLEEDFNGPDDTTIYDTMCNPIAQVPAEFSDNLCMEGSGTLEDDRAVNWGSICDCGRPCPHGQTICYTLIDSDRFPWGMGSKGNALEPLRSIAVDNGLVAFGALLYLKEWDGVAIPSISGLGGFTHDGCFRADDVGVGVNGTHYDFFAGTEQMWKALEKLVPTNSRSEIFLNPEKCAHLAR